MPALKPQPIEVLYARAVAEYEAGKSIFDLPRRSFWRGHPGFDLSVTMTGARTQWPSWCTSSLDERITIPRPQHDQNWRFV